MGEDLFGEPFAWKQRPWGATHSREGLTSNTDPSSTLFSLHEELRRALQAPLASHYQMPGNPSLAELEERLAACESTQAAQQRRLAALEDRFRPAGTMESPCGHATFAERMAQRIREESSRIPGVTAAYMQPDGLKFTLAGYAWTSDLSEAGADLAVKLQNELAPDHDIFIDGGFEALGDRTIESWVRVFP